MVRARSTYCLVLAALLIGIIFSASWLYPLSVQVGSKGKYSFVPIRYGPHTQDDNYFYYAHIREMIDGNFLPGDPATFENKDKLSLHVSYSFSLLMCSLGGFITKNTAHAYYFNYFVYPMLNFLAIYYLFLLITGAKYLSIFSSLLIIFIEIPFRPKNVVYFINEFFKGGDFLSLCNITRTPNILFTNIHIFVLAILLFLICEKKKSSPLKYIFLIFSLGISPLVSAQNFFVSYAVYFFVLLAYFRDKALRKRLLICFFASLIVSSPGIFLIIKSYPAFMKVMPDFFSMPGFIFSGISTTFLVAGLKLLFIPFLGLIFMKFSHKKFILSAMSGIIAVYLFLTFVSGTYASGKIIRRGSELLFAALVVGAFIAFMFDIIARRGLVPGKALKRSFRTGLILLSFCLIIACLCNQYQICKNKYRYYNDPEFKNLYLWSMRSAKADAVALTLDFDLLTNLIVYSPVDVYIPQVVLSPASTDERLKRFYEALKFYGVTPGEFGLLLDQMQPHIQIDQQRDDFHVQMALMELVLFYGRFDYARISDPEKAGMVKGYADIYNDKNINLSFKADYLIISKFDEIFVHPGSAAEEVIRKNIILYQNGRYKIYKYG